MSNHLSLTRLRRAGVIAVLRAPSAEACVKAVDALVAGGVFGIEITYSTPDAPAAIAEVARIHGENVVLGAGTLRTIEQIDAAAAAGAAFLVSPGTDGQLAAAMTATGLITCLGAFTPSEIMKAQRLGADVVKVFPASLGGTAYLKALRGPFPDIPLMPTGGVSIENMAEWFAEGAVAVGAGGDLCPASAMENGDWALIEDRACGFRASLDRARAAAS